MCEKLLHKENIEVLFHASKTVKLLCKSHRELTPKEKEEWIKSIENHKEEVD